MTLGQLITQLIKENRETKKLLSRQNDLLNALAGEVKKLQEEKQK